MMQRRTMDIRSQSILNRWEGNLIRCDIKAENSVNRREKSQKVSKASRAFEKWQLYFAVWKDIIEAASNAGRS